MHAPKLPARQGARGFTLIELLAVILIISILVAALTPMINDAIERAKVNACQANLRAIYQGMIQYNIQYNRAPDQSGAKFMAQLISKKAMENTKPNAERLTCPAVEKAALTIGQMPWEQWWTDLDQVDGTYTAYAGRDLKEHPLRSFPGKGTEPLVCDDNDPEMNHRTATNCLYADGSVHTYELEDLRDQGLIGPEEEILVVGPNSPVEDLRKFTLN
jgi:prepilin-type N-terminal cleavage/methylation domain-containing protein/prepilin-type processing-associated H-X9-DG protein